MQPIGSILAIAAIPGATPARRTRLHPLMAGLLVGVPVGAIGLIAAAGATSPAALGFGGLCWLAGSTIGSLGAFVGGLRREHIEGMQ